jgi:hypothetical protein
VAACRAVAHDCRPGRRHVAGAGSWSLLICVGHLNANSTVPPATHMTTCGPAEFPLTSTSLRAQVQIEPAVLAQRHMRPIRHRATSPNRCGARSRHLEPAPHLRGQDNPPVACAGLPGMKLWQSVKDVARHMDGTAGHPQSVPTYRRIPAVGNCRVSAISAPRTQEVAM